MDAIRVVINPLDGVCYSAYERNLETGEETWSGPPGSCIILTEDLAHRTNLTINWIFGNNMWGNAPKPGSGPDDTENKGIIGMLHFDRADWSPCAITRTLMRSTVVDYSETPLVISELLMAARITGGGGGQKHLRADSVLQPFDTPSWYLVSMSLFLYGVLLGSINFLDSFYITPHRSLAKLVRHVATYWIDLFCNLLTIDTPTRKLEGLGVGRVIFLLWCIPAYLLGELYGGELIAYLSSASTLDLITSWDQLFDAICAEQHHAVSFSSSWLRSEGDQLFGTEVAQRMEWIDSLEACFDRMFQDTSRVTVWMDTGEEVMTQLMINRIKPPEEVYIMGEGLGLGAGFVGMCYNPRRKDLKAKFDPWIRRYSETGHITHWIAVSELNLTAHFCNRTKNHDHQTDGDVKASKGLVIEDFAGAFTCYVLIGMIALTFLLFERHVTAFLLPPHSSNTVDAYSPNWSRDQFFYHTHYTTPTLSRSRTSTLETQHYSYSSTTHLYGSSIKQKLLF